MLVLRYDLLSTFSCSLDLLSMSITWKHLVLGLVKSVALYMHLFGIMSPDVSVL